MENKPVTWKEYKRFHRKKEIHRIIGKVMSNGIFFESNDFSEFRNEILKDIKQDLKTRFKEITEDLGE